MGLCTLGYCAKIMDGVEYDDRTLSGNLYDEQTQRAPSRFGGARFIDGAVYRNCHYSKSHGMIWQRQSCISPQGMSEV